MFNVVYTDFIFLLLFSTKTKMNQKNKKKKKKMIEDKKFEFCRKKMTKK